MRAAVDTIVRRAGAADVPAIQRVGLLTWPTTYLTFTSPEFVLDGLPTWRSRESVRAAVDRDITFVAEHDGAIVGMITLGSDGRDLVIWRIYVIPATQGRGVGRGLMDAALAAASGRDVLIEFVDGNERARRFYERCGFVPERREESDVGHAAVWMRRRAACDS